MDDSNESDDSSETKQEIDENCDDREYANADKEIDEKSNDLITPKEEPEAESDSDSDSESEKETEPDVKIKPEPAPEPEPEESSGYDIYKNMTDEQRQKALKNNECFLCEKKFASFTSFKKHMIRHTGVKNYKCHVCDKKFAEGMLLTGVINVFDVIFVFN